MTPARSSGGENQDFFSIGIEIHPNHFCTVNHFMCFPLAAAAASADHCFWLGRGPERKGKAGKKRPSK